ncbi:MAG TPA: hypothetical protein VN421_12785, partial [Pseudoflavonifractor sp.]|nr:hypothetical protein [Pseudoflavonifractor sp.]
GPTAMPNPLPTVEVPLTTSSANTPLPTDNPPPQPSVTVPPYERDEEGYLILPPATSHMFPLSAMDAALFDGALDQDGRFYDQIDGITLPYVSIFGQYEEDGKLYVICNVVYQRFYPSESYNYFSGMGAENTEGRAVLIENDDGTYTCEAFDLVGDGGDGFKSPIPEFCGPLTELTEEIMTGTADSVSTFPDNLIDQYCEQIGFLQWGV